MKSGFFKIPKFYVLVGSILIIVSLIAIWYFSDSFNEYKKLEPLVGGGIVGLLILLLTVYLDKQEFDRAEALKSLGVIDVYRNRKDKAQYGKLIDSAKNEIIVLGVTASRMMEDFASKTDQQDQQLIQALARGVKVKIMLCKSENLSNNADRVRLQETTIPTIQGLQKQYPNLEFKQFEGKPNHSIFKVDNQCIVGPVFQGRSSKDSPSIVMDEREKYVTPYIDYFNSIWEDANDYHNSAS